MSFFGYLSSHPLYLIITLVSVAVVIVFAVLKYPTARLFDKIVAKREVAENSGEKTETAEVRSENAEQPPSDGKDE